MLPLYTANFPSSASALEGLLNQSLRGLFAVEADPASIRDLSYPHLTEVRISLDGASLRPNPPRPAQICGETSPALLVDQLSLNGRALSIGPAIIDISLSAHTVSFVQGKDSNEQIALALGSAAEGQMEISIPQSSLAAVITALARSEASRQGITIDTVQLDLQPMDARSLAVQLRLRIRKSFFNASLDITGQLQVDDRLDLTISGLNCTGNGGIASLACGVLKPYLRKIEAQKVSLMLLPLGDIHLRDVRFAVTERLTITAEFGSAIQIEPRTR